MIIGTPGKSNAFAISEKLGLDKSIVEYAKTLVSSDNRKFELVIEKLEQSRLLAERHLEETLKEKEEFEKYRKDLTLRLEREKAESEKLLEKAKAEASGILKSAKITSDFVLQKAEEAKKTAAISEARQEMRREADDQINPLVERKPEEGYVLPRALKPGDRVLIFSLGKEGTVLSEADKSGNVGLLVGNMRFRTKLPNLKLLEHEPGNKKERSSSLSPTGISVSFSPEIDLRGELADDAWFMLDKYLDSALIAKVPTVHVIHGKGTGALRKRIWQELQKDKRVSSFRSGAYGEGDTGVTVIELKIK